VINLNRLQKKKLKFVLVKNDIDEHGLFFGILPPGKLSRDVPGFLKTAYENAFFTRLKTPTR
jgi:hypothetical protein